MEEKKKKKSGLFWINEILNEGATPLEDLLKEEESGEEVGESEKNILSFLHEESPEEPTSNTLLKSTSEASPALQQILGGPYLNKGNYLSWLLKVKWKS